MASRFLHDPKYALAYGLLALLLLLAGGFLFREAGHLRERAEGVAAENQLLLSYQHAERNAARQDFLSSLFQKAPASVYEELLAEAGYEIVEQVLLPDAQKKIERELMRLADSRQVDLIITTGGTGLSLRDVTPEATMAVATRNVPGIAEAIRAESLKITRLAMLSRGVSVVRGQTLIVNLPGSTKAVEEALAIVLPQLEHGLRILKGTAHDCARK